MLPQPEVVPLHAALRRLPGLADAEPMDWSGPRWWWCGPLDVEGLALGSMRALGSAVSAVAAARGRRHRVTTSSAAVAASFDSFAALRVDGVAAEGFASLSGFRRTRDGWVRLHANYPHHREALLAALGATPRDLDEVLLERSALDVEESVVAHGGVASAVRTPEEWLAGAVGRSHRDRSWIRFDTTDAPGAGFPWRAGGGARLDARGILHGIRVLDLSRVIAGPSGTRLLAALGADVLRVDPPHLPELWDQYVDTGFGKRSAIADLREPQASTAIRRLVAEADVLITGYRPGALARFGLDPASLGEDHPHLAVVAFDAWGDHGDWAGRRGFDSIVQAASGIAHLYGKSHEGSWRPGALPVQALDHATGLGAAAAALALLAGQPHGVRGSAHLSLAGTAAQLLALAPPRPEAAPKVLARPLRHAGSAYGRLDYVPPPLVVDGQQLEYPHPPPRYGGSELTWL